MSKGFTAILDHVVFQFEEGVHGGQFTEPTVGSIVLAGMGKNHVKDAELHRWAIVKGVGKDVKEVKEGQRILIEKHRWTSGFKVGEEIFWRTNTKSIMAIDERVVP